MVRRREDSMMTSVRVMLVHGDTTLEIQDERGDKVTGALEPIKELACMTPDSENAGVRCYTVPVRLMGSLPPNFGMSADIEGCPALARELARHFHERFTTTMQEG